MAAGPQREQGRLRRSDLKDAAIVFTLGMIARVIFCFLIYPHLADRFGPGDGYDVIALNIARGNGYVLDGSPAAAERLPLYPLLLAVSYFILGARAWPWQLAQCLCGAVTCVLVLGMVREYASRATSVAAATVCALHPTLLLYAARPLTETLYTLLLVLFVRSLSQPAWRGRSAGSLLGLQLLIKSSAFLDVAAFIPSLCRMRLGSLARAGAWTALVLLPWLAWNVWAFGEPHLFTATSGRALYHGLYISRFASWTVPAGDLNRDAELALWQDLERAGISPHANVVVRDRFAGQAARAWIAVHPYESARLWMRNLLLTWYLGRSRLSMLVYFVLHGVLLAAAVPGAVRMRAASDPRTRELASIAILLILAYTVFHAVAQPAVRYVLPVVPLVIALAAGISRPSRSY
jgi:4-amino-4-deoxy-L-arabinose transferase-like glycosyltransferase